MASVNEICDAEKLRAFIASNKLTLVFLYERNRRGGEYLSRLVEHIAWRLEPAIRVVHVDVGCAKELEDMFGSAPRVALFIDGVKTWEQIGFFYSSTVDKKAISRGILHALRSRGLKPSQLGLRLDL